MWLLNFYTNIFIAFRLHWKFPQLYFTPPPCNDIFIAGKYNTISPHKYFRTFIFSWKKIPGPVGFELADFPDLSKI